MISYSKHNIKHHQNKGDVFESIKITLMILFVHVLSLLALHFLCYLYYVMPLLYILSFHSIWTNYLSLFTIGLHLSGTVEIVNKTTLCGTSHIPFVNAKLK